MRLLKRLTEDTFELESFDHDHPPPYSILSHTWLEDQEVTYDELRDGTGSKKTGFDKIRFCGKQAAADGLQYFWVDTCCIDKSNISELETAINYMFRWYQRSSKCYVYLSDVSVGDHDPAAFPIIWTDAFRRSRWFKRGWTLQELMAPGSVEFFSREDKRLGSKITLEQQIHDITRIPRSALRGHSLAEFSFEDRMSWVASRETTVKEDRAYCLLGIFGVFLPIIRGEGEEHAMRRLRKEIRERKQELETEQTSSGSRNTQLPRTTRPFHAIPFPRDPDFVDRGTILDELREKFSVPMSRVALVGIGGVGKSQLAIEHCYRTLEAFPGTWVLWAHASSAARLEKSFREIAELVKIEGRQDPRVNIFQLVHDWMRDTEAQWLLVLDNVDDADFLFDTQATSSKTTAKPLLEYLPHWEYGSILITTRNNEVALRLVEQRDTIALDPMNALQAQALLEKKLGAQAASSNTTKLAELATVLEHMPLALAQAAAYILQRAPLCSVTQYLDQFRISERKRTNLLSYDKGQLRRDKEAKNSIIMTWQISFDYIQKTRPSAADLLSLMSFFDRQGIPRSVLQIQAEHEEDKINREIDGARVDYNQEENRVQSECDDGDAKEHHDTIGNDLGSASRNNSPYDSEDEEEDEEDEDDFEDDAFLEDVMILRDFRFISVSTDTTTFEMHALVQLSMHTWLTANGKLERFRGQFIHNLSEAFPTGDYENWSVCQALFTHAIAATNHKPKVVSSLIQWAELMYNAAWYAMRKGGPGEAETLALQSLKVLKKVLGREHEDTLWSMEMVARAYKKGGKWDAAEELEMQVMKTRTTKLGSDHPVTLISMGNLACTYSDQGRWEEAEKLEVQVMETCITKLGANHSDTLISMNNLAFMWKSLGWSVKAIELMQECVQRRKKMLGASHPDTIGSLEALKQWEEEEEEEGEDEGEDEQSDAELCDKFKDMRL